MITWWWLGNYQIILLISLIRNCTSSIKNWICKYLFGFQKFRIIIHFSWKVHHGNLLADVSDFILHRWWSWRSSSWSSLRSWISLCRPTVVIWSKWSVATLSLIRLAVWWARWWQWRRLTRRKCRLSERRLLPEDFCSTVLESFWQVIERSWKLESARRSILSV